MPGISFTDCIVILVAAVTFWRMAQPSLQQNESWKAVITPLASIIGSGFLVAGPLLGTLVGRFSTPVMAAIVIFAYWIGGIIRYNILEAEPLQTQKDPKSHVIFAIESFSSITLGLAYVISVAFYLRLLSSFALTPFQLTSDIPAKILTTVILMSIGIIGWRFGLHALERLESHAVTVKLSIIAALFGGLLVFDIESLSTVNQNWPKSQTSTTDILRYLGGMLLIIQGFETPRYLASQYSRKVRAASIQRAQIVSGIIYVCFILLASPLLTHLGEGAPNETAIIGLAGLVSPLLPFLLVIAAVMSQFSAAVADTAGAGGLASEASQRRIVPNQGYLVIVSLASLLVWFANIFEIISLASRMFAFYYLLQGVIAFLVAGIRKTGIARLVTQAQFLALILLLTAIVLFGKSVE